MQRGIKSQQRLPRLLAIKMTGVGTAALAIGSKDATLVKNGTGDFTITIKKAFARAPVVVATPITAGCVLQIAAATASSVQILVKDAAGVAKDGDVHILVHGFDAKDEY